jgi:hypothetical protein
MSANVMRMVEDRSPDSETRACSCTWGRAVNCGWGLNPLCPYARQNRRRDAILALGVVTAGLVAVIAAL